MKHTALLVLALAVAMAAPVRADDSGGISGYIVDEDTGAKLAGAIVILEPPFGAPSRQLVSDSNGFFSDITLEPGRYRIGVLKESGSVLQTCRSADVFPGEVFRIRLIVYLRLDHYDCSRPPPATLVDPNQTADVYRI